MLRVGASAPLTATAILSDGSRREVPAVWSTSNPAVAYVSVDPVSGHYDLLQGAGAGDADITATWTPVSSTAHIVVRDPASLQEISGVVHEAGERASLTLPGARVEISGGLHDGTFVVTDERGRFDFPDVPDTGVDLIASRPGYQSTRVRISALSRDSGLEITMSATSRIVERTFNGTLFPDCAGRDATRSLFFTPRHDGILLVSAARVNAFEGGYNLYRGSVGLSSFDTAAGRAVNVETGLEYELRVSAYCAGPSDTGTFRVVFTSPE